MAGTVEKKLQELGIVLMQPRAPMANYVRLCAPAICCYVSGQVCVDGKGKLIAKGQLGGGVTDRRRAKSGARLRHQSVGANQGRTLATSTRWCASVRLGGFVNSAPDFPTDRRC